MDPLWSTDAEAPFDPLTNHPVPPGASAASANLPSRPMPPWRVGVALSGVLGLALAARLIRLDHGGFLTLYYAAAVRSMSADWHNFLFAAFDPLGFLAIDKPPVAFWPQVAAVKLLGFSPFALRLPQVLEGVAAVGLLFHLVSRRLGTGAGLIAAMFLAISPLNVAVDRSNDTDACLVLVMLLAAWPLAVAAERARLGWLVLAAAILGIGFNVKMLAAMVVAPAFIVVYWFGAPAPWRRRLAHLAAAGLTLTVVSLSWPMVSELTPPDDRPYVDSTPDNSVLELAIDHNALDRFVRPAWLGRSRGKPLERMTALGRTDGGIPAGVLRLADPRLATQVLWLLPLAFAGVLIGVRRDLGNDLKPLPLDPRRQAAALWMVWVVVAAMVYSFAGGLFQPYYLAPLGPGLAALAAIGVTRLRTPAAMIAAFLITAAWQAFLVYGSAEFTDLALCVGAVPLVGALIATGLVMAGPRLAGAAMACAVLVLLVPQAAWTAGTILAHGGGNPVAHLVEPAQTASPLGGPSPALARNPRLVKFLTDNRGGARWLLATPNARQASPIIMQTGEPVMAVGGFLGSVPILTPDDLAHLVSSGDLRFVLIGGGPAWATGEPRGGPGQPRLGREMRMLRDWVLGHGQEVPPEQWRSVPAVITPAGERRWTDGPATLQLYDLAAAHSPGS
jgi:4-amino-4-deoxy-L-arabinose transferase-like glycosyltransferase